MSATWPDVVAPALNASLGPEGADVAIFAGDREGIIYVQGERAANVPEDQILPTLLAECRKFQDKVARGEAKLGEKKVDCSRPTRSARSAAGGRRSSGRRGTAGCRC